MACRSIVAVYFILALLACSLATAQVHHATPDTFHSLVGGDKHAFVEFYAPWCGHCKKLAPEYEKVGSTFKNNRDINIVAVDADAHHELGKKFGVSGYPTLHFFAAGSLEPEPYTGGRTAADIAAFINKRTGTNVKIRAPTENVVTLDPSNFDEVVFDPTKHVMVEFFAPWCGHCKNLAPKYELLAQSLEGEETVTIAKVDADKHKDLAARYGVSGFPTLKWFSRDNKSALDYTGAREVADLVEFVNNHASTERVVGGGFIPEAGTIEQLTQLAKNFVDATSSDQKNAVLQQTRDLLTTEAITTHRNEKFAQYYAKAMEQLLKVPDWTYTEIDRLRGILKKGVAAKQLANFHKRINILSLFSHDKTNDLKQEI